MLSRGHLELLAAVHLDTFVTKQQSTDRSAGNLINLTLFSCFPGSKDSTAAERQLTASCPPGLRKLKMCKGGEDPSSTSTELALHCCTCQVLAWIWAWVRAGQLQPWLSKN